MNESAIVHPWTQNWWSTLPSAYRAADALQATPPGLYQVGLNSDPAFQDGTGGWTVKALTQEAENVAITLERLFVGLDTSQTLHVQLWWSAPVPGSYLSMKVFGQGPVPLDETTVSVFGDESGMETIAADVTPGTGGALRVQIDIGGIVGPDNAAALITVDAINVGYREVPYATLPGVLDQPAYPLMRFMDGPGRVAGLMRDISDQAWAGHFADPDTAPDTAIPWLAQMLGTPTNQRNQAPADLRVTLQNMAADGRPAVGTKQSIITTAKQFLQGDGQVLIQAAGPTTPAHTIVMLVRSDQVPGGNLPALVEKIKGTGVIPAGHVLTAKLAVTTWDAWEVEAGTTWADVEASARTWSQSDSLGVELEG